MEYLGLFCLGAFVGSIATLGLRFIKEVDQWQKAMAAVLPAVLSGVAMVAVDRFKYSPALGCYPLGLVAALMWAYVDTAVDNVTALRGIAKPDQAAQPDTRVEYDALAWKRRIGIAHLAAATVVTAFAAVLAAIPACLQIVAELEIKPAQRVVVLLEERRKASLNVTPPSPSSPASVPAQK